MSTIERKIAILGYRSVGKSSLRIQFAEGKFVDSYNPTMEHTFTKSTCNKNQDYEVKLLDTTGQDKYHMFLSQEYVDVDGFVLVYDITSTKSFDVVQLIHAY